MNNKIIYGIIYGIIILCIVCIILVSVLSTGHKVLDIILVVISGIGILAGGYLIYKNKKTAKVAPDSLPNSLSGSADNENLDPKIYKKIEEDRISAIKKDFHNTFVNYFKGPTDENDKESENYVLGQIQNYKTFLSTTKDYLNNKLSIENYFEVILPLFNYTEDNEDDLKKNIIKYVVFYYLPEYNKVGVEKPHNYKILVDLYIKNKIKNEVDEILSGQRQKWNKTVSTNLEAFTPNAQTQLNTMYHDFGTQYEKDILIAYIEELLKVVKDIIITGIKTQSSNYFMRN